MVVSAQIDDAGGRCQRQKGKASKGRSQKGHERRDGKSSRCGEISKGHVMWTTLGVEVRCLVFSVQVPNRYSIGTVHNVSNNDSLGGNGTYYFVATSAFSGLKPTC